MLAGAACCCRADVLVRCNGTGQYLLSSGVGPNLYGPGVNLNFEFQSNSEVTFISPRASQMLLLHAQAVKVGHLQNPIRKDTSIEELIACAATGILGQSNRFIQRVLAYVHVEPSTSPVVSSLSPWCSSPAMRLHQGTPSQSAGFRGSKASITPLAKPQRVAVWCSSIQGLSFTDMECKPLRSDYAADLSDANLAKFNVPQPSAAAHTLMVSSLGHLARFSMLRLMQLQLLHAPVAC